MRVSTSRRLKILLPGVLAAALSFVAKAGPAQAPHHGVVRTLAGAKFTADDSLKCLSDVLENGDPDTGPSTFLLKATPNCVVPPHYHTAEEQLIVVQGQVSAGMDGVAPTTLGPGGFAMMPGKDTHWFTCQSKEDCLMFVTFDRKYDVVWVQDKK